MSHSQAVKLIDCSDLVVVVLSLALIDCNQRIVALGSQSQTVWLVSKRDCKVGC